MGTVPAYRRHSAKVDIRNSGDIVTDSTDIDSTTKTETLMDREYFENLRDNPPPAKQKAIKPKQESWKVIHSITKEIVISGSYILCKWKLNQLPNQYKIVPK